MEAYKGQTINISLLNHESATSKGKFDHEPNLCLHKFTDSYIADSSDKRKVPICGNERFGSNLFFMSSSNIVEIVFNPKKSEDKYINEYGILRLAGM